MTEPYAWWTKALGFAGDCGTLTREQMTTLGVDEQTPQPGFYRKKVKDGLPVPVAIWADPMGNLIAKEGDRLGDALRLWTWVCAYPITEATYRAVAAGATWPRLDETVAEQIADRRNSDPANENEVIRDQIESAKAGASAYAKITDDDTLAKAQSLRSRLLELKGTAEKRHKSEKEPHLAAGRAVDAKWLPLAKDADAAAGQIKTAMSVWETEKLRQRRAAERKAEDDRRAAEAAAKAAEEAGKPKGEAPAPTEPAAPPPASAPTPIRGNYGRAASVALVNVVTGITDQAALYEFMKDHPDLKALLLTLAQRAVTKGHTVPGVSTEEQAKVA